MKEGAGIFMGGYNVKYIIFWIIKNITLFMKELTMILSCEMKRFSEVGACSL